MAAVCLEVYGPLNALLNVCFGFAATFNEARTNLRKAEETSALETDVKEVETSRKRRKSC